ncbi:sialate O-acetylesterase [Pseudomonas tohonis]|uniref:sialate O-acetylesterase n=1 Tax=Pseudomonas tohonis TaxID=2725477 RepID=UPI0021D9E1B9|nr:sialate O-acetylesterase [Pseudomonas tohonis]UXY53565.1 sialate O-acetylesterase [Pseudomonas tohonis]
MGLLIHVARILVLPLLVLAAFFLGVYSGRYNVFSFDFLGEVDSYEAETQLGSRPAFVPRVDAYGRNVFTREKQEVSCPEQHKDTGVILVVGQSNSANHASFKYHTRYNSQVFNYLSGKCFVAASPLLGATGEKGEFATMLADELVSRGVYRSVVLVASGVGGSTVSQWGNSGPFGEALYVNLLGVREAFRVTDIVWHQGESDFEVGTTSDKYINSFKEFLSRVGSAGVEAPVFISISTICGKSKSWQRDNSVSLAQRALIDNSKVFLGADTDALLAWEDRNPADYCHLGESGQRKTAAAYAAAISHYHLGHY